MKNIHLILLAFVTVLFVSCNKENNKITTNNLPAINVKTAKVISNVKKDYLSVSGKIQAAKRTELSTKFMGFADKIHVNVGDNVKKGQLLVSINNTDLVAKKSQIDSEILKAKSAFKNAEKNYNRYINLFKSNSITQKEMDDMKTNYEIAKANLESSIQLKKEINAQFAYTNIKAPFSGVITAKNIENGNIASPGKPLISLEATNSYEVIAMVPESEISQVKKGTKVTVLVKAINKEIKGKITEISSSAKNTGGQYFVKMNLEEKDTSILSGMFATVIFPIKRKLTREIVLIPTKAIVKKGQLSGIYTVSQNNTALLRWLRLGKSYGNEIEVLSGLSANETFIISAEGKLFNGAKLIVN